MSDRFDRPDVTDHDDRTTPDTDRLLAAKRRRRGKPGAPPLAVVPDLPPPGADGRLDFNASPTYRPGTPSVALAGKDGNRSAARDERAGRPAEMGEAAPHADGVRWPGSPPAAERAGVPSLPRTGPARARPLAPGAGPEDGTTMPVHPLRRPVTADRPTDVGTVVHAVAAALADEARDLDPHDLAARVVAVAGRLVVNKVASRRRAVWFEAVGHASLYLRCLVPGTGWAFLGAEVATAGGPVDLAWEHPALGVLYDELKTTGHGGVTDPGPAYVAQAARYAAAGTERHGDRFLGVRLVVLGGLRASRLVTGDGTAVPLAGHDPTGRLPLGARDAAGGVL